MAWPTGSINTTNADQDTDSPLQFRSDVLALIQAVNTIIASRGGISGIADLDANGLVPVQRLPAGSPNGVASLDANALVPASQIPGGIDAATLGGHPASYFSPASSQPALNDLTDVVAAAAILHDTLLFDGTNWIKATLVPVSAQVFDTVGSATWTRPAGVTHAVVTVVGGGGGGGPGGSISANGNYGTTTTYLRGSRGGHGGVGTKIIDVAGIPSVPVTVGGGGAGGSAGGTSSFGTFLSSTGGAGGANLEGNPGTVSGSSPYGGPAPNIFPAGSGGRGGYGGSVYSGYNGMVCVLSFGGYS